MAAREVDADGFAAAFGEVLEEYARECGETERRAVERAGRKSAETLRQTTDPGLTGEYAAGWRASMERTVAGWSSVVHNDSKPSLTHLLELGHGGPAPAPAHPHIEPAYREGAAELERRLARG